MIYNKTAAQNADEVSFETIPCGRFLLQMFNQFKWRAKSAESFLLLDL